jgi:hypothetical protein
VIGSPVSAVSVLFHHKWRDLIVLTQKLLSTITRDTFNQIKHCDALLVCSDTDRGYLFQGKAYAQILDSLGDRLRQSGLRTQSIAGDFSRFSGNEAYGSPVTMNRFLLRNFLFFRLRSLVGGQAGGTESWRKNHRIAHWRKILKKCNPQVVFAIQPEMALCRAGHEIAIPIFDVQHGIISDTEDNPYYLVKNLLVREPSDIPHGFLCWDNSSADMLLRLARQKGYVVHVIGNPWFARFEIPDAEDTLVRNELFLCDERKRSIPAILVTLQYNLNDWALDYVSNDVMASSLEQTIRETCDRYFWYIRLHPSQIRNKDGGKAKTYLRNVFGTLPNVDWDVASRVALPALLATVDLHITHFSAVTIEAAWSGVRTGLLDPHIQPGHKHEDLFSFERTQGYAELIPLETVAIKNFIESVLKIKSAGQTIEKKTEFDLSFILSLFHA